ncbi:daptide-type RiPP [Paenibacillus xanthanilyticus]|uniref:Daptide-type RiPP n=1 Tax=Paenibacillus xanthanilyticus TaxID=1783531 RepID=A0ABV8JU74_9BACL
MQKNLSLQLEEMEAVAAPGWADIAIGVAVGVGIGVALT